MNAVSAVDSKEQRRLLVKFRLVLGLFIVGLVLSGVTAFPLLRKMSSAAVEPRTLPPSGFSSK